MKCFYHHESSAIGTCKNCNRGICEKCFAEVGDSIACLNRCEEKTKAVIALVNKNIEMSGKYDALNERALASYGITAGAYNRSALWVFLMGGMFLVFGFNQNNVLLKSFGILCFIGAAFSAYSAHKYKSRQKNII
jgi:hypothetical protein